MCFGHGELRGQSPLAAITIQGTKIKKMGKIIMYEKQNANLQFPLYEFKTFGMARQSV